MELTGAEILVRSLQDEGVEYIFGYPGGAVLHIYDALYRQDKLQHILTRHEQGATHAADGYARSTGKPGVVLVTSGPGATNAVTGIATAYMDSIPMVVFTGQVPTQLIGNDAFQEADNIGITRPCVKHNFLVKDVNKLAETIKKAFYVATTGRPGPVVVDIPKDVTAQKADYHYPDTVSMRSYNPVHVGHAGQIKRAVKLMLGARRPMIYTGGGVILSNAAEPLAELARLLDFPVTNTLMGLGGYPATDRQFVGMLGMHGTYEANMAMHHCDVLIAIGARFDDRVTGNIEKFCPHAKIVHVDIDPSSISKNVKVDVPIVGSVDNVLRAMVEAVKGGNKRPDANRSGHGGNRSTNGAPRTVSTTTATANWSNRSMCWRPCTRSPEGTPMLPPMSASTRCGPRSFTGSTSRGAGSTPAGWAPWGSVCRPRWACSWPIRMRPWSASPARAASRCVSRSYPPASSMRLPIKIVNLNNRYLGMVRQWQEFFYQGRYAMSYMESLPDFVKLAESYGHVGMQIDKPGDVEAALVEAMKLKDRLVFMDFITDQTENVYPMIPAGGGQNEMILI